jgi:plasmid stabilization system protein ParE
MATIVVTPTAQRNLQDLIKTLSLPPSTTERFKSSLEPLGRFPRFGAPLEGRWAQFRFVLGPWRWMLIVYEYDEPLDRVAIVTIRDARSARSPRGEASLET